MSSHVWASESGSVFLSLLWKVVAMKETLGLWNAGRSVNLTPLVEVGDDLPVGRPRRHLVDHVHRPARLHHVPLHAESQTISRDARQAAHSAISVS